MIVRAYAPKPWGRIGTAAPAFTRQTALCSTLPFELWSSGNDHMIERPMGTGGNPPG